jgi:hypothetical protein
MQCFQTFSRCVNDKAIAAASCIRREAGLLFDRDRFLSAGSWQERLAAVSWLRAAVLGGTAAAVAVALGVGMWLLQPEFRGRPPRLPTEQEWKANQDAGRAMEAELSPALAAANQAVPN